MRLFPQRRDSIRRAVEHPAPPTSLSDAYRAAEKANRAYAEAVASARANINEANRHRVIRQRNGIGPAFAIAMENRRSA